MTFYAYAKINLCLDALYKRADGYHELRSVMQSVSLHDTLKLNFNDSGVFRVQSDDPKLPVDGDNICGRAFSAFQKHTGLLSGTGGLLHITKRIPVGAGLAGGSSDAAALLCALNRYCGSTLDSTALSGLGAELGSDVPFCLHGGAALCEGRGERLTTLPSLPDCHIVIIMPPFSLSTAQVFSTLDLASITIHPDTDALAAALRQSSLENAIPYIRNVFPRSDNRITGLCEHLLSHGALCAEMSGSGPSVFGVFQDEHSAAKAMLNTGENRSFIVKPVPQIDSATCS